MSQYNPVSQMPSHGNASNARVANGREGFQRGGMAGQGQGSQHGQGGQHGQGRGPPVCSFATAPPQRTYCTPAVFTDLFGRKYIPISQAYGNSVPMQSYY